MNTVSTTETIPKPRRWLWPVVAVLALIAGCSGGNAVDAEESPSAATTAEATATTPEEAPSPAPVVLTREQAADRYMEIITPTNDALNNLDALLLRFDEGDYTSETTLMGQVREAALAVEAARPEDQAQLVELQSTAIEGLDPTVWHNAMADLLRQNSALDLWIHALTEAQIGQDLFDAADDFVIEDTGAADVVRAYLGLPPRPVEG